MSLNVQITIIDTKTYFLKALPFYETLSLKSVRSLAFTPVHLFLLNKKSREQHLNIVGIFTLPYSLVLSFCASPHLLTHHRQYEPVSFLYVFHILSSGNLLSTRTLWSENQLFGVKIFFFFFFPSLLKPVLNRELSSSLCPQPISKASLGLLADKMGCRRLPQWCSG